jgi:outer membrane protein, adhesin transport system
MKKHFFLLACVLLQATPTFAMEAWTLQQLRMEARKVHPAIISARQEVVTAQKNVDVAKRLFYPNLSATLESGGKDAVAEPSRLLRVEQVLWDGGRTSMKVDLASMGVDIANLKEQEQTQAVDLQLAQYWQEWLVANGRIAVARGLIDRLNAYKDMMERRVAGGLSTEVELKLIESEVLKAQVEMRRAALDQDNAKVRLEQLTGRPGDIQALAGPEGMADVRPLGYKIKELKSLDWSEIAGLLPTVQLARADISSAELNLRSKQAELKPQLYARIDQSLSNKRSTFAFIGVQHSLGQGFHKVTELDSLASRTVSLQSAYEAALLESRQTLMVEVNSLQEAYDRYGDYLTSLAAARHINESYIRQFGAGKKSWLDVINSVRDLAQNEFAVSESAARFLGHLERLAIYAEWLERGKK